MVWRQLLLILTVGGISVAGSPALVATECRASDAYIGNCNVNGSLDGDSAVLSGNGVTPGSGASAGSGSGSGASAGAGGAGGGGGSAEEPFCEAIIADSRCLRDGRERPGAPATPTITLSDIASFRPAPGVQYMQPNGWTVAGLHTNFYAVRPVEVLGGTLLGQPASVRFTATTYHWTYGDGTAATLGTPGGTWQALGIAEFDPTPTSHVYQALGEYTIRLSIDVKAEYRWAGGGWIPISGRLTVPANDLHITVGTADTVLVEHDCTADPTGPGC